jgi:hypothetical protein
MMKNARISNKTSSSPQMENPKATIHEILHGEDLKAGPRVAGLNCDKYGGPTTKEIAAEMVYRRDIHSNAHFVSPFAKFCLSPKQPDEVGWNNIHMSMEMAVALALAMGRILVLSPAQHMQ